MIIPSPAIDPEVAVDSKDVTSAELVREMNQKRIRQIDVSVPILRHNAPHWHRRIRKTNRNEEFAGCYAVQDRLRSSLNISQQVTTLRDDGFAGDQGSADVGHGVGTSRIEAVSRVEQGHDHAGVQQDRLHRPKPFMCSLFDAKSPMPEANFPCP